MKENKFFVNSLLLLLVSVLFGGIAITAVNYMPINQENKRKTMEMVISEGDFPQVFALNGEYGSFQSMEPTSLELATDELMLRMALYEGEGEGIEQAFLCYSTKQEYESEYSRYWHGYVTILRPLLLLFDYYEIRLLNILFQSIIIAILIFMLWQQRGIKYALALFTTYLLLMPMAVGVCLQYSWSFYATFVPLLIYIRYRSFLQKGQRYCYYFMIVGIMTNYLDLLTYPLLSWGILITWWIILDECDNDLWYCLKKVIISGIAWIVGYGGMWIGKWALGSIVLQQNLFRKAISEALLWTVNEGENAITIKDRLEALYVNWSTYDYKIYLIVLVTWLLYWIVYSILYGWKRNTKSAALLLIFTSSLVWFVTLAGHSIMHHIFTHRIYGVSIAAFLGIILLSTDFKGTTECKIGWKVRFFALFMAGVLSTILMFQMKDEYNHHNGGSEFTQIVLTGPVYMDFKPEYSQITDIYIGFSVINGDEGYCKVQVLDQGKVIEEERLLLKEYLDGNFHRQKVDWNLRRSKEYTLVIEPIQTEGEVQLWVTAKEDLPLSEFGNIMIDDYNQKGQMLSGITYWCVFPDMGRRILFLGTYMVIFMMVFYVCGGKKKRIV